MDRHLHIDPFNGVSGDMLLSALVDLGAPQAGIEEGLNAIGLPGVERIGLGFAEASSHGVRGLRLRVDIRPKPARSHARHPEIQGWIEAAPLAPTVRARALRALRLFSEAHARTSGSALEEVPFWELGGFDTVIDLVGAALALESLRIATATFSPIPLPRGVIRFEGSEIPCPASATLEILRGAPTEGLDLAAEIVTPTGAALIVTCATPGPPPLMTLEGVGVGFGVSEFAGRPNCLRLLLGVPAGPEDARRETLVLLEANVDDLSAEILATLIEVCLEAGALDAWLTPILMKKGRPAHQIQALCTDATTQAVESALFRHSTTLGIRRQRVERGSLAREWKPVETPWGTVLVKVGRLAGEAVTWAPELEDCRAVARAAGVPLKTVYAAALAGFPR